MTAYAPVTRRHYRMAVRNFAAYLYENNIIARNLSQWIIGAPNFGYANPPKFLRSHEIQNLFNALIEPTAANLRAYAMMHLAYMLGLRPIEISRIKLDDIHFTSQQITIPNRKSRNPIRLPVAERVIKAIAAYMIGARPKSVHRALFLNRHAPFAPVTAATVSRDIAGYMQKAGLKCSAYWLRHTYAQNLLETGHCIFEVKQMLGHDSIQTTKRYLHIHPALMRKVIFDESL
jgi:site-specific recombinase XerD